MLLAFDAYYFWFYLTLYLAGFLIIQMGFRLKGRDISIRWLLPEISFAVIVAFIGTSEKFDPVIFEKLTNFAIYIILFGTTGCISVLIYDNIKYELPFNSKFKKFVLAFAISLLVLIPYISFQANLFIRFPFIQYIIYLSFLIFPFLFIYGTYRYSFIPEQVYFSSSVTIIYLSVAFILLYAVFISIFNYLVENLFIKNLWLFNIVFLVFSMYSVDFENTCVTCVTCVIL